MTKDWISSSGSSVVDIGCPSSRGIWSGRRQGNGLHGSIGRPEEMARLSLQQWLCIKNLGVEHLGVEHLGVEHLGVEHKEERYDDRLGEGFAGGRGLGAAGGGAGRARA